MNYLDWYVGMKVSCFRYEKTRFTQKTWLFGFLKSKKVWSNPLTVGEVYTIRQVCIGVRTSTGEELVCVNLFDDPDPLDGFCYPAYLFRPLHTRKTDISVFTEMLKGRKVKV